MKGGASTTEGNTLINFLEKATNIEVLTDQSISCLTLKITGETGIYKNKSFEGGNDNNITTILVKLLPTIKPKGPVRASIKKNKQGYNDVAYGGEMDIVQNKEFYEEIQTSINVYFSTLLGDTKSYQEPVCPAILEYFYQEPSVITKLIELKNGPKFKERDGIERKKNPDTEITDKTILENILDTSPAIIVMEFLEGYTTLSQYKKELNIDISYIADIRKLDYDLNDVNERILAINRLIKMGSDNIEIQKKKTEFESEKKELEKQLEQNKKKILHFAYYYVILYQIYRMTIYSKIRHQDLHTQNIMIKTITDIPDIEIKGDTIAKKIKSILDNKNFKINIKIIDFGEVRELETDEIEYCSNLIKTQKLLFEKYFVFNDDFKDYGFLHLIEVIDSLKNKDTLNDVSLTPVNLKKFNYFDVYYNASLEAFIKEEDFKRFELLIQKDKAPLMEGVASGAVSQGRNRIATNVKFYLKELGGNFQSEKNNTSTIGGGKKSKKNNKRKGKNRSKKNKKTLS